MKIQRATEHLAMPWKNGLGVTQEIVAFPSHDSWIWRVSLARVEQSAPFSAFPGIDRIIAVVEGDGMRLVVNECARELARFQPFAFRGEDAVHGELYAGRVRDINLMTRRGRCTGSLVFFPTSGGATELPSADVLVIVEGSLRVGGESVGAFDAIFPESREPIACEGGARVAAILFEPT